MKNIIITGGLGYIGTELCKIYSGESWNSKVTIIDNRFISERVTQLRDWYMNYVNADIRDRETVKPFLKDADIVHHLAGITDVSRTKDEIDIAKDKEIEDTIYSIVDFGDYGGTIEVSIACEPSNLECSLSKSIYTHHISFNSLIQQYFLKYKF